MKSIVEVVSEFVKLERGCKRMINMEVVITRLPANLRPITRKCVLSFTVVTSGHVIKMAVIPFNLPYPKPHAACKLCGYACFTEPELLPMKILYCGNRDFDLCSS